MGGVEHGTDKRDAAQLPKSDLYGLNPKAETLKP